MLTPNRAQKGDVALLLLAAALTEAGLIVLKPLCESVPFDLVVYYDKKFYRIQVKRAQRASDGIRFDIPFRQITVNRTKIKVYRYTIEHADFIAGVVIETKDVYLFPIEETLKLKATIRVDPTHSSKKISHNRIIDPEKFRNVLVLNNYIINLNDFWKKNCQGDNTDSKSVGTLNRV